MTGFFDNILTQMSSAFNSSSTPSAGDQAVSDVHIDLSDDKTLKWRSLYNNQYALGKRRSRRVHEKGELMEDVLSDTNSNLLGERDAETEMAPLGVKVETPDPDEPLSTGSGGELRKTRVKVSASVEKSARILRRKTGSGVGGGSGAATAAAAAAATAATAAAPVVAAVAETPAAVASAVDPRDDRKRRRMAGDDKDTTNPVPVVVNEDENVAVHSGRTVLVTTPTREPKKRGRKKKIVEEHMVAVKVEEDTEETDEPLLSPDSQEKPEIVEEPAVEEVVRSASAGRRSRKREAAHAVAVAVAAVAVDDSTVSDGNETEVKQESGGEAKLRKGRRRRDEATHTVARVVEEITDKPRLLMTIRAEKIIADVAPVVVPTPAAITVAATTATATTTTTVQEAVASPLAVKVLKRRGRKPKNRPVEPASVKKSPRLSKDGTESVLASAMARKEKSFEPSPPQQTAQRFTRRIKPTAKILANDELRHGFELQNNARLSLSCENLEELDTSRSPRSSALTKPGTMEPPCAVADEVITMRTSLPMSMPMPVTKRRNSSAMAHNLSVDNIYPAQSSRRPCPEPEEFLNEIKSAQIGQHRSPELNKKLNKRQQRRLIKQKEKHFHQLGLKKAIAGVSDNGDDDASDYEAEEEEEEEEDEDEDEEDEPEEFVPKKKISVSVRPGVTLRVRRQMSDSGTHKLVATTKEYRQLSNTTSSCSTATAAAIANITTAAATVATTAATAATVVAVASRTELICLCEHRSQVYTQRSTETSHCSAIDEIELQRVGCSNETSGVTLNGELMVNLLRPSVRASYMVLCESHKHRLAAHNSCAGCGVFCTQGNFMLCNRNHFFHRECAVKYILNSPASYSVVGQASGSNSGPSLVHKCPHCGGDASPDEIRIVMKCRTTPIFLPSQRNYIKPAKMSLPLSHERQSSLPPPPSSHRNRPRTLIVDIENLIPDNVIEMLMNAQKGLVTGSMQPPQFTGKDFLTALSSENVQRIAEIVASGFDITQSFEECFNGTCLHLVSNHNGMFIAYLLLCRVTSIDFIDMLDKGMRTAIMCATAFFNNDLLKLLIQCGGDVTIKGPEGMTALHLAAKVGNFIGAQIILSTYRQSTSIGKFEAFVNAVDDGCWTAMVWAAEHGHAAIVSHLINLGADANICDTENNTVLHWAALSDKIETLTPLMKAGCNVNMQNINGDTALHIACRNGNTKICLTLLAHGASLDTKNQSAETPYDCIPDEESNCARTIQFNLQLRQLARLPQRKIVCHDISNGRELYPIQIVRVMSKRNMNGAAAVDVIDDYECDQIGLPDFKYITKSILLQNSIQIDRRISQMRICSCSDNCATSSCQCSEISVQNWYSIEGRLNGAFNYQDPAMIFECNDVCGCNRLLCKNRVVQNGVRAPLQIFECEARPKGWGVRGLMRIQKGTFIAEYTGEILTDAEADRRTDDSYFFDLGASEHCIDANFYGNVSRFFNHSCRPNIVPIRVYFEHQDLRFPKIAFFACRDIDDGEEITFDYGEKFWQVKSKLFGCQCGASTCRYAAAVASAGAGAGAAVTAPSSSSSSLSTISSSSLLLASTSSSLPSLSLSSPPPPSSSSSVLLPKTVDEINQRNSSL